MTLSSAHDLATAVELAAAVRTGTTTAVDATRACRAALHGFVSLEAAGGFGLPVDVDRSYERLIDALDVSLSGWPRR